MKFADLYEKGFRLVKLLLVRQASHLDAHNVAIFKRHDALYLSTVYERSGEWIFGEPTKCKN